MELFFFAVGFIQPIWVTYMGHAGCVRVPPPFSPLSFGSAA